MYLINALESSFEASLAKSWALKVGLPEQIRVTKKELHRILIHFGIDVGPAYNSVGLNDITEDLT